MLVGEQRQPRAGGCCQGQALPCDKQNPRATLGLAFKLNSHWGAKEWQRTSTSLYLLQAVLQKKYEHSQKWKQGEEEVGEPDFLFPWWICFAWFITSSANALSGC